MTVELYHQVAVYSEVNNKNRSATLQRYLFLRFLLIRVLWVIHRKDYKGHGEMLRLGPFGRIGVLVKNSRRPLVMGFEGVLERI